MDISLMLEKMIQECCTTTHAQLHNFSINCLNVIDGAGIGITNKTMSVFQSYHFIERRVTRTQMSESRQQVFASPPVPEHPLNFPRLPSHLLLKRAILTSIVYVLTQTEHTASLFLTSAMSPQMLTADQPKRGFHFNLS